MSASTRFDVIVLGAGAAGMMAAFEAGRGGRRVLLLDHGERVGRKILISGGGRCNFTNIHTRAENFLSENPHFAKSALARFTPADMIALVEKHGIRYHEKTLGQLFCDSSAQQIVSMLERECAEAGVVTRSSVTISAVQARQNATQRFAVDTSAGEYFCDAVVVATGGLSIPKMGATGFGYELAEQFGHTLVTPRPGLVPLVFDPDDRERWCDLSGLSAEVVVTGNGDRSRAQRKRESSFTFREKLLITHRGVSGPAVLQASSYWNPGDNLSFDLAPGRDVLTPLLVRNARRDLCTLTAALRTALPVRWAERWAAALMPYGWTNAGIARMEAALHAWTLTPAGTEGFAKAEVTVGGVDTRELDARTMESKRVPGLYFIGEVVDVTGWLGGYNFQWAWASGVAAAQAIAQA